MERDGKGRISDVVYREKQEVKKRRQGKGSDGIKLRVKKRKIHRGIGLPKAAKFAKKTSREVQRQEGGRRVLHPFEYHAQICLYKRRRVDRHVQPPLHFDRRASDLVPIEALFQKAIPTS